MTTLAFTADICTYPSAIARACAALDESLVFRDLPDGYFRVVVRLIKKINLSHLFSPIVASRGTIARESGKSIETVGRAVKWLEERKLVTREQRARAGLRGSSAPLVPTAKFIDALTLRQVGRIQRDSRGTSKIRAEDRQDTNPNPVEIKTINDEHSVGVISTFIGQSDLVETVIDPNSNEGKEDFGYPQDTNGSPVTTDASISTVQGLQQSYQRQPETAGCIVKTVKIGKFRIPADLAWLIHDQNLAPTGLLSLMSQASNVGQRLSDVVALTQRYLVKLSGRRLYAYLSTLVRQGKDYGYIRAHREDEDRMNHDAARETDRLAIKAVDWVGRQFSTSDRTGSITVEAGGWLRIERPGKSGETVFGTRRMDVEFVRLVDRDVLRVLA